MAEKSYRIKTKVGQDKVIQTSLSQDVEFLEVLSLKINQEDTYKLHVSNYGIIVGRVLANEAFGIPNAKVSIFIKLSDEDSERSDILNIYPYKSLQTKDKENKRYNLLSDSSNDDCHRIVGTFPNKRLVLDNDTQIEIYEKYWKYTTVTNQSGDYMIFGVPTGNHNIHVDIDLSDIGILSQKPRDFYYKGYNQEQFDNSEQFKDGVELENLTQLLSQDTSVYVYPFFGDSEIDNISITRCDVQVPYKFEPTCVFFGSIISDRPGQHIGHECGPTRWIGYNRNMVTGEGTIEMIRKTPDGLVEEFPIKGNHLIDGDGVWCYQIPMNLDYIGTDEFGNIIPVQDSTKGIPTRTSVRFRISMQETKTEASTEHIAKYLVPNIHALDAQSNKPKILNGNKYNLCYEFGSATPDEYFRDLLWNKVYTIKNYIPRFERRDWGEKLFGTGEKGYSGVRSVSSPHQNNIFPFNSARFHLRFNYRILCILMTVIITIISFYNKMVSETICWKLSFKVSKWRVNLGRPLSFLSKWIKCIGLKGETFFEERAKIYYFPKCDKDCGSIIESKGLIVDKSKSNLEDVIQQALALEYELVNLDFHNDWINGTLYMPLWFWKKRAKKKYLFGLFSKKAVNTFCSCDKNYSGLKLTQGCSTTYNSNFTPINIDVDGGANKHREFDRRDVVFGVIKEFTNNAGLHVYYYAPGVPNDLDYHTRGGATNYTQLFATDIVLLGSLNNCDLDNLPKIFDSLPSTTVNIPFIATINGEESGDGVVTGVDWGHNGGSTDFKYSEGLFIDLTCWKVSTRHKSCVNLARLSELYVTLDMDMRVNDESEANITHDGLITYKEIVDNETRAKFASLNHNGLTNLIKNTTTNYDTYKFHYIYPISFDGHLGNLNKYQRQKNYVAFDEDIRDNNYVMYRLGEGKDSINGKHKKHFYVGSESRFQFPLYNNSFYFYFGLKEGKTSIDKFNTLFNASCAKQNKYAFTIDYISKPGKWCYDAQNIATDFGTIDIEFNGLSDIFSYALYNEFNELLIEEFDVQSSDLRFGYDIQVNGGSYVITNDGYKRDGRLKKFKTGELVKNVFDEPIYLENGVYFLEVTNAFGLKVRQKINMIQNTLAPNVESINLGTKFKENFTQVSNICGEMDYYGEIRIKSFIIDGEESYVTNVNTYFADGATHYYNIDGEIVIPNDGLVYFENVFYEEKNDGNGNYVVIGDKTILASSYEDMKQVICQVTCSDGSEIKLTLESANVNDETISDYVCYGVGNVPTLRLENVGEGIYTLIFNIWKPGNYILTSQQLCRGMVNDNMSIMTLKVNNGESFQAFLNGIPLNIISNSYFNGEYKKYDSFPRAWLQLENPNIYEFPSTQYKTAGFWDDYISIQTSELTDENGNVTGNSISTVSKIDILKFQIETIAKMRDMGYIMGNSNLPQLTLTTVGGKEPILIRSIHPNYSNLSEENEYCGDIIVENVNTLEAPLNYTNIIDYKYQNTSSSNHDEKYRKIRLNDIIYGNQIVPLLGNYFAAFTNNGGLVSLTNGMISRDPSLYVETSPIDAQPLYGYNVNSPSQLKYYPPVIWSSNSHYFRSLFLDKRVFADGDFFLPVVCNYIIDGESDETWKYGRWEVQIFNIAPMVYDDDYNIIGEKLSYEIKIKAKSSKTINFTQTTEVTEPIIRLEGDNYYILEGMFLGQNDVTISGTTADELLEKIMTIYDNKICDASLIIDRDGEKVEAKLEYIPLIAVNKKSDLDTDIDVKLTSNLMWVTDLSSYKNNKHYMRNAARLYKCLVDIDGIEYDMRSKFINFVYGSEKNVNGGINEYVAFAKIEGDNGLLIPAGKQLSFEIANCKMIGDLSYETESDGNGEEYYTFKSYIEGADSEKMSFDIGECVNVLSAALTYDTNDTNEYFMWNNQKIFINTQKENDKFYFYRGRTCNYHLMEQENENSYDTNYYIEYYGQDKTKNTVKIKLEVDLESENKILASNPLMTTVKINENGDEEKGDIKGYTWVKRQYLKMSEKQFLNLLETLNVQEILNRYGIPIYTMLFSSIAEVDYDYRKDKKYNGDVYTIIEVTRANYKGIVYTFDPYTYKEKYYVASQFHTKKIEIVIDEWGSTLEKKNCKFENYKVESVEWKGVGGYKYQNVQNEATVSGQVYDYYYIVTSLGEPDAEVPNEEKGMIFIITNDEYNNISELSQKNPTLGLTCYNGRAGDKPQILVEKNGYFYVTSSPKDEDYEIQNNKIKLPSLVRYDGKDEYSIQEVYSTKQQVKEWFKVYFYCKELNKNGNEFIFNPENLIPLEDIKGGEKQYVIKWLNVNVHIEYNELDKRYYFKHFINDVISFEYYKLIYVFQKYSGDTATSEYHYEIKDDDIKTTNIAVTLSFGDCVYNENNSISLWKEVEKENFQAPLVKGKDGYYYCYQTDTYDIEIEKVSSTINDTEGNISINKSTTTVGQLNMQINPEYNINQDNYDYAIGKVVIKKGANVIHTADLYQTLFRKFELKQIEDFSCAINTDEYNSSFNMVEVSSPVLSCAVISNYGFPKTDKKVCSSKYGEVEIPKWETSSKNVVLDKRDVNYSENKGAFLERGSIFIYDDKIKTYEFNTKENKYEVFVQIDDVRVIQRGEFYYLEGKKNLRNVFKENINTGRTYYGNANMVGSRPWGATDKDAVWDEKYRQHSPLIGEIYPYFDKYIAGEWDENGFFALSQEDENLDDALFYASGSIGNDYGKYSQCPIMHPMREEVFKYNNISGTTEILESVGKHNYSRMGIGILFPILRGGDGFMQRIYDTDELYNKIIFVYQPNSKEEIMKGTEIISCNFVRTYYDENSDYRYKVVPTYNQSTNFHVGPVYIGNIESNGESFIVPFYFINDFNQDIKNGLTTNDIRIFFDNRDIPNSAITYNVEGLTKIFATFYTSADLDKRIGQSSLNACRKVSSNKEKYAVPIARISQTNAQSYIMYYGNLALSVDEINNIEYKKKIEIKKITGDTTIKNIYKLKARFVPTDGTTVWGYVEGKLFSMLPTSIENSGLTFTTKTTIFNDSMLIDSQATIKELQTRTSNIWTEYFNFSDSNGMSSKIVFKGTNSGNTMMMDISLLKIDLLHNTSSIILKNNDSIECTLKKEVDEKDNLTIRFETKIENFISGYMRILSTDIKENDNETNILLNQNRIITIYINEKEISGVSERPIKDGYKYEIKIDSNNSAIPIGEIKKDEETTNYFILLENSKKEYPINISKDSVDVEFYITNELLLNSGLDKWETYLSENNNLCPLFSHIWYSSEENGKITLKQIESSVTTHMMDFINDKSNYTFGEFIGELASLGIAMSGETHNYKLTIHLPSPVYRIEGQYYYENMGFVKTPTKTYIVNRGVNGRYIEDNVKVIYASDTLIIDSITLQEMMYDKYDIGIYLDNGEEKPIVKTNSLCLDMLKEKIRIIPDANSGEWRFYRDTLLHSNSSVWAEFISQLDSGVTLYDMEMPGFLTQIVNSSTKDNKTDIKFNITSQSAFTQTLEGECFVYKYDSENIFNPILREQYTANNNEIVSVLWGYCDLETEDLMEIICDDGYSHIGFRKEKITCVDNDGNEIDLTLGEIMERSVIGLYISHLERIDDMVYKFISKIENIKILPISCGVDLFGYLPNEQNNQERVVLSIEVKKIIHKFPFIYDKNKKTFIPFE